MRILAITLAAAAPALWADVCTNAESDAARLDCFDRLARCAVLEDTSERLTCYDERIQLAPADAREPAATAPAARRAPAVTTRLTVTPVETRQIPEAITPTPSVVVAPEPEPAPGPEPESEPEPEMIRPPQREAAPREAPVEPTAIIAAPQAEDASAAATEQASKVEADDEAFPVRAPVRSEPAEAAPPEDEPRIIAHIVAARRDHKGLAVLTLDNEQVWRELKKTRFNYTEGIQVEITRGVLGSTNLKAQGMKKYAKVTRLK